MRPSEALWTCDITQRTWQQQHPTGDLPPLHEARSLTVMNGRGYLLVTRDLHDTGLEIYELDLQKWHWQLLKKSPYSFHFDVANTPGGKKGTQTVATAVVKVK